MSCYVVFSVSGSQAAKFHDREQEIVFKIEASIFVTYSQKYCLIVFAIFFLQKRDFRSSPHPAGGVHNDMDSWGWV